MTDYIQPYPDLNEPTYSSYVDYGAGSQPQDYSSSYVDYSSSYVDYSSSYVSGYQQPYDYSGQYSNSGYYPRDDYANQYSY